MRARSQRASGASSVASSSAMITGRTTTSIRLANSASTTIPPITMITRSVTAEATASPRGTASSPDQRGAGDDSGREPFAGLGGRRCRTASVGAMASGQPPAGGTRTRQLPQCAGVGEQRLAQLRGAQGRRGVVEREQLAAAGGQRSARAPRRSSPRARSARARGGRAAPPAAARRARAAASSTGIQCSTSARVGSRLRGGRALTTFVTNTSRGRSRPRPAARRAAARRGRRTGGPARPRSAPGASPTTITSASPGPSPGTRCDRVLADRKTAAAWRAYAFMEVIKRTVRPLTRVAASS